MSSNMLVIKETDLAVAWARAFLASIKPGHKEIVPLVVTVSNAFSASIPENSTIRKLLEGALNANQLQPCETVSSTIFPKALWNPGSGRETLYRRYLSILPSIKREDSRNRYGTYFARLISFGKSQINQLEGIISGYESGNHRRSAMQAALFDPAVDRTNQRQRGFPCLQQVAFSPIDNGELAITGFYATQYLFERAYGNYLGLCNLGLFVGHALGLRLTRMTCIAAVAVRDIKLKDTTDLVSSLQAIV